MTNGLDRRNSVTRDDFISAKPTSDGGVWYWQVYDPGAMTSPSPELPLRSVATWQADSLLSATLDLEDMWAAAINQACTKIAIRGFEISDSDDSSRRTSRAQDLIMNLDGMVEYRSGMSKLVQDFLLCRNGCFLEVERVSKSPASKVKALWHLDSLRCRRTGNIDYPVVYFDFAGHWHAMRSDQVIYFVDMPSPRSRLFGIGKPAAERAFKTIAKLAAVETYFREKITGARALKLVFISGVSRKQLNDVQETGNAEMERRGYTIYKGAVMVPTNDDRAITTAEVDLAGVPDGFDVNEERRDAYLRYANAIGIPAQDLQPLHGQGLGTAAQTKVLDDAASGKGLEIFPRMLEDKINWLLMPKTTTFVIKLNDLRDQEQKAKLDQTKVATLISMMGTDQAPGFLTKDQVLNMAADEGLVPKEFLPQDITPEGTVTDSGEQSKPAPEGMQPVASVVQQVVAALGQKVAKRADAEQVLKDAALIEEARQKVTAARG